MQDNYTHPSQSIGGDKSGQKRVGRKPRPIMDRFLECIDNREPDRCWNWIGHKAGGVLKYGRLFYDGRVQQAHRVSYQIHVGPIPEGLDILHSCDNSLCVNPAHLRPGTHTENMREMIAKGRGKTQTKDKFGEQSVHHTLTEKQAYEILELLAQGYSQRVLGEMYGVSGVCIYKLKVGKSWPHLNRDILKRTG